MVSILNHGGIAVIPTDTIYGIVARARDRKAALRLCRLRRERAKKPFIILIDNIARFREFNIHITSAQRAFLEKVWPGKVSVILPCLSEKFSYLHRGANTLAFRLPKPKKLRELIAKTGPLLAPSVNTEGNPPATTIVEAKKYFGDNVDRYLSAGKKISGKPSTLVSFLSETPKILRQGAVKIHV